jgi:hypothetical protein
VFGGGIAPLVAIALVSASGTAYPVSLYVLAMVAITLMALAYAPETANADLRDDRTPVAAAG